MSKITLTDIKEMFAGIRADTEWDLDGDMVWGYFFTDPDPKKLESLARRLARDGYHVVDVFETEDKSTHFLHVERVEKHTPQTLHVRNAEFYRLAEEYALESY